MSTYKNNIVDYWMADSDSDFVLIFYKNQNIYCCYLHYIKKMDFVSIKRSADQVFWAIPTNKMLFFRNIQKSQTIRVFKWLVPARKLPEILEGTFLFRFRPLILKISTFSNFIFDRISILK